MKISKNKGISLAETVVALGVMGMIGTGFLTALYAISSDAGIYDQRTTASILAQSQMERIKAMEYDPAAPGSPDSYPVAVALPVGYTITISEVEVESGKQEVTVRVTRGGRPAIRLTEMKTDW